MILHDENYTSFVGSALKHKIGGRVGDAYFKFWPISGRRDAYSRVDGDEKSTF